MALLAVVIGLVGAQRWRRRRKRQGPEDDRVAVPAAVDAREDDRVAVPAGDREDDLSAAYNYETPVTHKPAYAPGQPMEPGGVHDQAYAELDGQQDTYRTSALRAAQLDYGIVPTTSAARVADSTSRPPTSGPEAQYAAADYFEIADPIVDATYEAPCEDVDAQRMIGELKVLTVILKFARGSTVKTTGSVDNSITLTRSP